MNIDGKKIILIGDSIGAGYLASSYESSFPGLLEKRYGAQILNYSISGSRIARQKVSINPEFDEDFLKRTERIKEEADLLIVFGGTNDFGHGDAQIGSEDSIDPYTFYGALNLLIQKLEKRYPHKIMFILPLPRANEDNPKGDGFKVKPTLPLNGYVEIMKKVLDQKRILYLDLFNDPDFNISSPNFYHLFASDGLHPIDQGHLLIAQKINNFISINF